MRDAVCLGINVFFQFTMNFARMAHGFIRVVFCIWGAEMKRYPAYLFDADGTLIDTAELIYQCFRFTCKKFADMEISREMALKYTGLPLRKHMEAYLGPLDDEAFRVRAEAHMDYQMAIYRDHLKAFPGVREALVALRERGARMAVVTSRRIPTLSLFLKETGLYGFFSAFVTPESTPRHKPAPDPALEALRLLGIPAQDALFVGDSEWDMACGKAAGLDTAIVPWAPSDRAHWSAAPTYVLADIAAL